MYIIRVEEKRTFFTSIIHIFSKLLMYKSESFGRIFWVDENDDFKSCPLCVDGTGDFDCEDYVSEWTDWEGVNYETLFNIHQSCVLNKNNYAGSLTINGV